MGITERISGIFMHWFIREETFYAASCSEGEQQYEMPHKSG